MHNWQAEPWLSSHPSSVNTIKTGKWKLEDGQRQEQASVAIDAQVTNVIVLSAEAEVWR
jgi:hypothetical protein